MIRIPDKDEGDNTRSKRRLLQTLDPPKSIHPLNFHASNIELVNQTLTTRLTCGPTESESAGELYIGSEDSGQMSENPDDLEIEDDVAYPPNGRESVPLFPDRTAETEDTQRCLPQAVAPPQDQRRWHVSAPDIEEAIQTLCAKFGRAPTQIEVAEELGFDLRTYWQVLTYLKDLGSGTLYTDRTADSGKEELVYVPSNSGDDTLHRCLRSEMKGLLTEAIRNLPECERLVITFYYYESLRDEDISLILDIARSTVSTIRKSVRLRLCASLASSTLSERLRDLCARRRRARAAEEGDTSTTVPDEEAAHVVVSGSQSGWLPKGSSWERFGDRASWDSAFRSWYSLNDQQELTQIRRKEDYHLGLELGLDPERKL
jgi:hypothetical protein